MGDKLSCHSFAKAEKALRKIFLHLKAVEFVFIFLESFLLVRHNKKWFSSHFPTFFLVCQVRSRALSPRCSSIISTRKRAFGYPGLTSSLSTSTTLRKSSRRFWCPLWTLSGQHGCLSWWLILRDLWYLWGRLGPPNRQLQRISWGDLIKMRRYVVHKGNSVIK